MEPTDLTIEILRGIREDTREIRDGLRKTNENLDGLRSDVDAMRNEFIRRNTEMELRVATEVLSLAGAVREVRDVLRQDLRLRDRA